MTNKTRKSSEVIAEPGNIAARLDPLYTEIVARQDGVPDIRVRLRSLTLIERVYCDGVKARGMEIVRDAEGKVTNVNYNPASLAEYVFWTLRLGIDSAEGVEWTLEPCRVLGLPPSCVKLECLNALPPELQQAALEQIQALSELSPDERVKLDFTSPLRGGDSPDATA